jgi:hypothetical protein
VDVVLVLLRAGARAPQGLLLSLGESLLPLHAPTLIPNPPIAKPFREAESSELTCP